jgi:cytochrome c-type biogenesis protein CcmH/NrfG
MDGFDLKKLVAEVSAEHGIRVDADDPIMVVVTLNRLVFEHAVERAVTRLQASADEINRAAARVQVRAGTVLAQEIKEMAANFQKEIRSATDALLATAQPNQAGSRGAMKWLLISIAVVMLAFLLGRYLGTHDAGCIHTGG